MTVVNFRVVNIRDLSFLPHSPTYNNSFVGDDDRHHKLHDLPGYDQRGGQGWQWRGLLPLLPRGGQDEDKVVAFREREKILVSLRIVIW